MTCQRFIVSKFTWLLVGAVLLISAREAWAQDAPTPEQLQFFETKIRPALVEHCYRCHSVEGSGVKAGLSVDSREGLRGGGESGPAVIPGNLEDSLLWTAINHEDFEMPPGRMMPVETIADFRRWIEMGAPDPRDGEIGEIRSTITAEDIENGKSFWAFQPPQAHSLPAPTAWSGHPVDRFLEQSIRGAGLQPVADAASDTVLRRLYFDLVGLPPTPAAIRTFRTEYDSDPDAAVSAQIDDLLSSAHFGERWGRHWLDVARYAESSGSEAEVTFPNAWRYRDWVIDAFNDDKPYDEFITQQIAGDLLPVDTDEEWAENLIATGFLALGPKTLTERNPRQFRADVVDEQIDVTTRAVLGISVACARCHDHKFDPIPQSDYYALAGIFQSTETLFGGGGFPRARQSSNLLILPVDDPTNPQSMNAERLLQLREQIRAKQAELGEIQREMALAFRQRNRPGANDDSRQRLQLRQRGIEREMAVLQAEVNQFDSQGRPLTLCMGVQDVETPTDARLLVRGEINQPASAIPRGTPQVVSGDCEMPTDSSGRLELARWMTSRENPLAARVMVNRVWMHLMGAPLVAETDNFGFSGQPPTHPELLDTLAVQFMEDGWSVKKLIRRIATSRAYRLSSELADSGFELDPNNQWYARANQRRLEAEAIRDAMLVAAGQLATERPRGSRIAEIGTALLAPGGIALARPSDFRRGVTSLEDFSAEYRSVYLPIARNAVPRSLDLFDFAEPSMVVGQREESNTATQALYLLNNEFVIEQAERFAERLQAASDEPREQIKLAFQIAMGREATNEELRSSVRFFMSAAAIARSENAETTNGFALRSDEVNAPYSPGRRLGRGPQRNSAAARRLLQQRFAARSNAPNPLSPLEQFCQSLLASAEFRYLR